MTTPRPDIPAYLAALPLGARSKLDELRQLIQAAAPEAIESISYGMPTFKLHGQRLAYVAAWKGHCALYGTPAGTLRFPLAEPLPADYITALIRARVAQIEATPAPA